MTSISYAFYDEYNRVLQKTSTAGDGVVTVTYIANVVGTSDHSAYLAWVAKGNKAIPYIPPQQGYSTVASAKATKIAKVKKEAVAYIHDRFEYDLLRNSYDTSHVITGETTEKIRRVFVLAEALIAAINAGSSIDSIRSASIDFLSSTHSSVS